MKKTFIGFLFALLGIGVIFAITAARRVPTIRPNVSVAGVEVGGLTVEDAARKMRTWWEGQKLKTVKLHSDALVGELPELRPSELGVVLDDEASVVKLPRLDTVGDVKAIVTQESFPQLKFDPIYKLSGLEPVALVALVKKFSPAPHPAKVSFSKGAVLCSKEVTPQSVDKSKLLESVSLALKSDQPVELPIIAEPKKIPDEKFSAIKAVVSSFTTHFPKRQINRNANIKLASSRLNGIILMPGDKLSFNNTVGKRTIEQGFKLAGVYKNGRHDTGIGGGICQVSTTLYNASLFGNLKIVRRSNHSLPVAYVPLGRDATVDFGNLDLVVENNYPTPIAISSEFQNGSLTFRVLGTPVPGETVKIVQEGGKSWDRSVKVTHDPKLKPGATVVVDKGSKGHSIRTFRLVYKDGVLVKKQSLGLSYYGGGDKIIAVGPTPLGVPTVPTVPVIQGTKASTPLPRSGSGG